MQWAAIFAFLQKNFKWILLVIGVIIFLMWFIPWLKRQKQAKFYNASVNGSQQSLEQLAQQGIHPSYSRSEYATLANGIQQALDGCGAGFDETLKPAFEKMKNDADVYALIKAYDVRTVDKCGYFTGNFKGDLAATLHYKFSGIEDYMVDGSVEKINEILINNGIKNASF